MKQGVVILHRNYEFGDGDSKDKWLVVLSPPKNGQVLVVKTTSQQRRRPLRDGCHPNTVESVYVFNANLGGFKKTTWVILEPIVLDAQKLAVSASVGAVKTLFTLGQIDIKALVNCLRRCDDVSPFHLDLLA